MYIPIISWSTKTYLKNINTSSEVSFLLPTTWREKHNLRTSAATTQLTLQSRIATNCKLQLHSSVSFIRLPMRLASAFKRIMNLWRWTLVFQEPASRDWRVITVNCNAKILLKRFSLLVPPTAIVYIAKYRLGWVRLTHRSVLYVHTSPIDLTFAWRPTAAIAIITVLFAAITIIIVFAYAETDSYATRNAQYFFFTLHMSAEKRKSVQKIQVSDDWH